jgi:hypothetical protein
VLVKNPSHRNALNSNQVRLLKVLFKFRFVSVPLLSEYLGKDKSTVYEQLLVLTSQDFVVKNYDSSYRLPPRPATYDLGVKGIKFLRDNTDLSQTALRNMYKNKTASESLVVHSLDLFKLCLQLKRQYPGTFDVFTKSELTGYDTFLRPLSDLYLQRKNKRSSKANYLLEVIAAGTYSWVVKKRLRIHQEWLDDHEDEWGDGYPTLLLVCGNENTEKRVQRTVNNGYFDFEVMTATDARLAADVDNPKVWAYKWEPDWDNETLFLSL